MWRTTQSQDLKISVFGFKSWKGCELGSVKRTMKTPDRGSNWRCSHPGPWFGQLRLGSHGDRDTCSCPQYPYNHHDYGHLGCLNTYSILRGAGNVMSPRTPPDNVLPRFPHTKHVCSRKQDCLEPHSVSLPLCC